MEDLICGIFALCLGSIAAVGAAINTWRAHCSKSWPTAKGYVTKSNTRETRRKHGIVLVADIEYQYKVGEDSFTGTTVRYLQPECSSGFALAVIQKYPHGKEVDVRYDSKSPEVSCLETGLYSISWAPLPFSILFAAVGIYLIFKK